MKRLWGRKISDLAFGEFLQILEWVAIKKGKQVVFVDQKNLQLLHRHCHDEKTAIDLIEIRKKQHSKNLKQLAQQWDKYEWEWVNDVPVMLGRNKEVPLDNGRHT